MSKWSLVSVLSIFCDLFASQSIANSQPCPALTKAPMPTARAAAAVGTINGLVCVAGGSIAQGGLKTDVLEVYDPANNSWVSKTSMPGVRGDMAGAVLSGKLYAIGGETGAYPSIVGTVETYDPNSNTWSSKASLLTPRRRCGAAAVNGKIYVMAGSNVISSSFYYVASTEEYDPGTNTWTVKASIPTPREEVSVAVVDGIIYVIGGSDDITPPQHYLSTVEAYNPSTNTWETKAPMPTARRSPGVEVVNGIIYVIGGEIAPGGSISTIEVYDPQTNAWTTTCSLPTSRTRPIVASLNNTVYVIGGFSGTNYLNVNEALSISILSPCEVVSFQQNDPKWKYRHYGKELGYDCNMDVIEPANTAQNIKNYGCALTSMAMLLQYYGVTNGTHGEPVDPENLNCYLETFDLGKGYQKVWVPDVGYKYLVVDWDQAGEFNTTCGHLERLPSCDIPDFPVKNPTACPAILSDILEELDSGFPVIVRVRKIGCKYGDLLEHFVLATCRVGTTCKIFDPSPTSGCPFPGADYSAISTLQQSYNNEAYGIRKFRFYPNGNCNPARNRCVAIVHSPVNLLAIDSLGRKTGIDNDSVFWNQIPMSGYIEDAIGNDTEDSIAVSPEALIKILDIDSIDGGYKFALTAIDTGQFLFEVNYRDTLGNQTRFSDSGAVQPGQSMSFYFKPSSSLSDSSHFSVEGDFDCNGSVAPSDVVQLLNFVFLANNPPCIFAAVDGNCDGQSSPADVVTELNKVFLGTPFPCPQ